MTQHTHPKKRKEKAYKDRTNTQRSTDSPILHRHNMMYGRVGRRKNSVKRFKTRTQTGHITQSRIMQHGNLSHVKIGPGWSSGHVTNKERAQLTWWITKKRQKVVWRGAEWRGMRHSYLSIQKICLRWGSDRCPFHMLPHAAWVWKE